MVQISLKHIRNFTIIAHIDHGKSTLADRMLEITGTVEKRKMKEQVLDRMELERERGITIKMQPVRMNYLFDGIDYILNLIDTPGHIDFSYEVSRALRAVEGSVLLVDATQGVQAQTISVLSQATALGLVIIPAVSKVDSPLARTQEVKEEIAHLLSCEPSEVLEVSGKTGQGVENLLREIVKKVPPPRSEFGEKGTRALVFDFEYSSHKGVIVYVRMLDGEIRKGDALVFSQAKQKFTVHSVGVFHPDPTETSSLSRGGIGYIITGIKKPGVASVGDTITSPAHPLPTFPGYLEPRPVVWASVYPEGQDDFPFLKQALLRLRLSDPSLSFEEETSGSLGRGFRCGFLGMLHLEIIMERLKREFHLGLVMTTPSITYEVVYESGKRERVYSPTMFPDDGSVKEVFEPWVMGELLAPPRYIGAIMQLLFEHEAEVGNSRVFGDSRTSIEFNMPLRELMRNFFDELKSASSGFASLSYKIGEPRKADVVRLDILVAEEVVPAFSRVVARRRVQKEAKEIVERVYDILPRQLFTTKIQGKAMGRTLSSKTLSALKKDVTGHLYGGDITRKRKLWEKQKKGKKRMKEKGRVIIPHDVFLKMMKPK
ncbi:MAG: translation elongation factor 4 [Patescibacteria group bacterium]|nr:MAG: translation elongation factor 4 [Patescibacteria group bacterium]